MKILTHLVKKKEKKGQDLKSFNRRLRVIIAKSACSSLHCVYKNLHVTHVTVSIEYYIFIFGGIVKVISMINCNCRSRKLKNTKNLHGCFVFCSSVVVLRNL